MSGRIVVAGMCALALGLAACGGDSAADQAKDDVCAARDDIAAQVASLRALTVQTVTLDGLRTSFDTITADLRTIAESLDDLAAEVKPEIEQANAQFRSDLDAVVAQALATASLSDARSGLTAAVTRLGEAYEESLATIDCG
jgi:hypothetical protein